MPIAPLMIEHRVIEKMITLINTAVPIIEQTGTVDGVLIETLADFIRTYADRCHHGKEEEILFRALERKKLVEEHLQIMNELIEDHKWGRTKVSQLLNAKNEFLKGKRDALSETVACLKEFAIFYPKHIEKEDKHFFYPCMEYFTDQEKQEMQKNFLEFNQNFTDKRYNKIIDALKK